MALQGIVKFYLLQINEMLYLVSLLSLLSVLSVLFYSNPAQGQINREGVLLAQQPLPQLPPNLQPPTPINQEALPQFDTVQQTDFNSQTTNQTTSPSYEFDNQYQNQNQNQYQNNQNSGRYVVYVDNGNSGLLQQVRRVEPTALLRQYQGRSVIQAGTFSKPDNAQRRLKELADNGINGVRVVSSNGQEIPYPDRNYPDRNYPDRNYPDRNYPGNNRSNYYYVVIPGRFTNNSRHNQKQNRTRRGNIAKKPATRFTCSCWTFYSTRGSRTMEQLSAKFRLW
jgi:hypothetical protein